MAKHIVICSDGTGNTANKDRGTNVFKLYEAVDLTGHVVDPGAPKQIAFYDDGVGTDSIKLLRVLGGAFGWGLSRNVRQLYADLVRTYSPDDRVYLFGFSRGAFTARTLAAFIAYCGILRRDNYKSDDDLCAAVDKAYGAYRARYMGLVSRTKRFVTRKTLEAMQHDAFEAKYRRFRADHGPYEGRVAFVGVWDTVDAVGLPFDGLSHLLNAIYPYKFTGRKLHPNIGKACHALAIDDERHSFHPLLWEETEEDRRSGRIKQIWFPGVHSNVGGGYPKQGMSLVALDWMMAEAQAAGLRFLPADRLDYAVRANVNDTLYDSRAGLGVYYRYKPRDIADFCAKNKLAPKVHESAVERVRHQTEGYAPGNIPAALTLVATGYDGGGEEIATRYPSAAQRFAKAHDGLSSLLQLPEVRWRVLFRRMSHYGFVALSLLLAAVLIWPQLHAEQGLLEVVKGAFALSLDANTLWQGVKLNPVTSVVLGVLVLLLWVCQRLAERAIERRFSRFWLQLLGRRRTEPPQDVTDEDAR